MKKFWLLIFLFSAAFVFADEKESWIQTKKLIKSEKSIEALPILEKMPESPKKLYYMAWAHYLNKNYKESLRFSKKYSQAYSKAPEYYPCLLLVAKSYQAAGDSASARKVLDFFLSNAGSIPDEFVLPAYLLKNIWFGIDPVSSLDIFPLGIFRLLYQDIIKLEVKKEKKQSEPVVGLKTVQLRKIKDTLIFPETGFKLGVSEVNSEDEPKDIQQLRKALEAKKKELEVFQMLIEEKKRLLNLKESYLNKKEEIEKKEPKKKETEEN